MVKTTPIITISTDRNCVRGTEITLLNFVDINKKNKNIAITKEISNSPSNKYPFKVNPM